ncbi:MAG: hypothetical protein ACRD3V_08220 [Vicinamibacteria bacterium]
MSRRAAKWTFALLAGAAPGYGEGADVPGNLVVDVRVYEARSTSPDFQAMENLSFFINTDGSGVSEPQWLATIARQVPQATLATLASDTAGIEGSVARFEVKKRSRVFGLSFDMKEFLDRGTFVASAKARLSRSEETDREFERSIELRLGQTYVFGSRDLELSASEYLSHFRDFDDNDHRGKIYESFRGYSFFLVVAVTLRIEEEAAPEGEPAVVSLDPDAVPALASPIGVPLIGEIVLELSLDEGGAPVDARIVRSSIPEVNPRILGEAVNWRFPEAAGKEARLTLSLRAEPQ